MSLGASGCIPLTLDDSASAAVVVFIGWSAALHDLESTDVVTNWSRQRQAEGRIWGSDDIRACARLLGEDSPA